MNAPTIIEAPNTAAVIAALQARFGDRLSTSPAIREAHGRGEGLRDLAAPSAVVFAETTEDVAAVLALCHEARVPVIPFGTGTSLEGQLQALGGGISLDLGRMDKVLAINAPDMDCRVQAGVTREALNHAIRDQGLFFPLDPGANASLGGMAATRASGTNAVRYGTMREVTLGLTVVTPQGRIIRTGGRARKSSAGYDLTRLYIGSEGTLGVITELQLRLFGVPEVISAARVQFPDLASAVQTGMAVMACGIAVARIELLDALQMQACIAWSRLEGFAVAPTLFLEFHGSEAAVAEQIAMVEALAGEQGGSAFAFATTTEARSAMWRARHEAYHAARGLAPGKDSFTTDACVPISRLADCIAESHAEAQALGLVAPIVGHVGDGNFHMLVLFDPADPDERARADKLAASVSERAIRMGGTCTGEHGIGVHKLDALLLEHGAEAVAVMQAIKAALDPHGIMNPGKTVPSLPPLG
ncbi:oxidoreductase [Polymorphobacter multimanifer]|uniref:FAD-binding oxidoreductase n=1 Tax=Polymorphobacter multimanifer TaxID=1070431 RepID=UPI00166D9038|nr:FAD-linked oxidase C-terminal domain-containing protein [Polymorphobacter multimanifer]GGI83546.1 oxidoreductase [Polymorphobacter multimanifer]